MNGNYFLPVALRATLWEVAKRTKPIHRARGWMDSPSPRAFLRRSLCGFVHGFTHRSNALLIWDLGSGQSIHRIIQTKIANNELGLHRCVIFSGRPSCHGRIDERHVLTWELATEQEQPPITLKAGPIKQDEFPVAAFTSDRRHLVTGRRTGLVEFWDLRTGERLQTFPVTRERFAMSRVPRTAGSSFPPGATTPSACGTWPAGKNSSN